MMEFYNHANHVARKEHKCELCRQPILKGELYSSEVGKYEGEFFDRKLHMHCYRILCSCLEDWDDTSFEWSEVLEWLRDCYCYNCTQYDDCELNEASCEIVIADYKT